jgi:hypothetical protein
MAIVGPFVGIIIGSFLTYWFTKRNEERRDLKEKQKTQELNHKFRTSIVAKLQSFVTELEMLNYPDDPSSIQYIKGAFELSRVQSLRNDIDSRPEIFSSKVLSNLYYTTYALEFLSRRLLEGLRNAKGKEDVAALIRSEDLINPKELVERSISEIEKEKPAGVS